MCEQLAAARRDARRQLTTSFRSVPAIQRVRERRVRAGHDRRRGDAAGRLRAAARRTGRRSPRQPAVVALPVPEPYGTRNVSRDEDRASRCPMRSARSSTGWSTRAAGRSPNAATAVRVRVARPGTSACCSGASSASATTSRSRTSARSRRAASATCSSAARRSTTARRSKRSARRSPRSSGRTTSCRCSRRCEGALFAIGDEELLEWKQRFGVFHPFRIPTSSAAIPARPALTASTRTRADRRGAARCCSACIAAATTGRSPTRSSELLDATRAHVGFVLRSAGEQALANVLHVAELARAVRGRRRHFVPRLRRRAARRRPSTRRPPRRRSSRRAATACA